MERVELRSPNSLVQGSFLCTMMPQPLGFKLELFEGRNCLTHQCMPQDLAYTINKFLLNFLNSSLTNERDWPLWTYLGTDRKSQSHYSTCRLLCDLIPLSFWPHLLLLLPLVTSLWPLWPSCWSLHMPDISPASGPLQWLFPRPGTHFPRYLHG